MISSQEQYEEQAGYSAEAEAQAAAAQWESEMDERDKHEAMEEMECWISRTHLKNCEKCRKVAPEKETTQ